jgi:shikimate dehydrogenase
MSEFLNGATRVHFIVGDPIAQVKSPSGVTHAFNARGHNATVMPAHVSPKNLGHWLAGVSLSQNVDGIIVTIPHKFAATALCATVSARSEFLNTVNTMRRDAHGHWHGDMFDGLGFVEAMQRRGCALKGKTALLVGAGGAGSAIAHALIDGGVRSLAIHDADPKRRDTLIERLSSLGLGAVTVGSADPTGYAIAVNATPIGMRPEDPHPIDSRKFVASQCVGCVITAPAVTPMIAAARTLGCNTVTGTDMFVCVRDLMVDFLLGA